MGDFEIFKKYLLEGNLEGVRNNFQLSFIERIVDDKYKMRPIHLTCENGNIEIAQLLIENAVDMECEDQDGWKPIHWACRQGNLEIVKLMIDQAVNIECEDGQNKMRPIHFACENGHLEIAKLLIDNKCKINCKCKSGFTPLILTRIFGRDKCAKLLQESIDNNKKIFDCVRLNDDITLNKLYKDQLLFIQEYDTDLSVLDVAKQTNANNIINYLVDRKFNDEELSDLPNDLSRLMQELILCGCIRDNHNKGFERICSADIINGQHGIIQSSFLELVAEHGSMIFVNEILKKSLYNKDSWQKAKAIANIKGHTKIVRMISEREYVLNLREKSRMSILHTAVCDNDPDMVQYILDNHLVDPDVDNEIFGTALALAYLFCYRDCIRILEQFKVNPNICNKYSQTPLHEAIASGMIDNCEYLVEKTDYIDVPGFMGFTALNSAVMKGYSDLCLQLVKRGADCNRYIELPLIFQMESTKTIEHFTALESTATLCLKMHGTIYPCIMDNLDELSVNFCDAHNNSLLHLSAKCMRPDICKQLINIGSMLDPINDNGNSPLLEILSQDCRTIHDNIDKAVAIVHLLSKSGADINKSTSTGLTVFQSALQCRNERLMLALMTNQMNITNISAEDFNRIFQEKWYNCAEILISRLDEQFLLSYVTSEIIHLAMIDGPSKLVKLLLDRADITTQKLIREDILYKSIMDSDDDMFDHLISEDICEPKLFGNGENLLSMLLKSNNTKCCDKLLRSNNDKYFVNLRNAQGQTPLQVALEMRLYDIADNLTLDSNDLNNEDNEGNTALGQLITQISIANNPSIEYRLLASIKSIISQGGDIYKVISSGHQVISTCTNRSIRFDIERFTERKQCGAAGPVAKMIFEVEKKICMICTDREVDCALQCGHRFCLKCSEEFVRCPVCRAESTECRRTFSN